MQVAAREPLIDLVDDLGIRNELRAIEAADEIADHPARARSATHSDRRRTPSLRNRAELSARAASRERVERTAAVRLHDDDAGGVRRSGAGDSADASRGEVAARRCDRVVRATRARSFRRRGNLASRRISRAPERLRQRRDRRRVERDSELFDFAAARPRCDASRDARRGGGSSAPRRIDSARAGVRSHFRTEAPTRFARAAISNTRSKLAARSARSRRGMPMVHS